MLVSSFCTLCIAVDVLVVGKISKGIFVLNDIELFYIYESLKNFGVFYSDIYPFYIDYVYFYLNVSSIFQMNSM